SLERPVRLLPRRRLILYVTPVAAPPSLAWYGPGSHPVPVSVIPRQRPVSAQRRLLAPNDTRCECCGRLSSPAPGERARPPQRGPSLQNRFRQTPSARRPTAPGRAAARAPRGATPQQRRRGA